MAGMGKQSGKPPVKAERITTAHDRPKWIARKTAELAVRLHEITQDAADAFMAEFHPGE